MPVKPIADDGSDQPTEEDALAAPAKVKPLTTNALTPTPDATPAAGLPPLQAAPPPAIPASTTPAYAPLSATPAAPAQSATWTNAQGQGQSGAISDVPAGTPFYAGSGQAMDTLSGSWAAPTAAPNSAPLISSAAGGTMTPQGDAGNAFRGYISDQGGTFGGFAADKADPAAWSKVANGDPAALKAALGGSDAELSAIAAKEIAKQLTMNNTQAGGLQMLANLSPEQQAAVKAAFLDPQGLYAADQAGYDPNRAKYQGAYEDSWKSLASQIPQMAAMPAGRLAGNYTAQDPAEQARLLASGATAASTGQAPALPTTAPAPTEGATVKLNGVQTTSAPTGAAPSGAGPSASAGGLPGVSAAPSGAFTATPTDPNDSLINKTLDYGPLTDRFKVAQSELENWNKTSDPQFQADLRDAMRKAAAGGALGSGMLQTSLGDIAQNRELQRQGMGTSFLNNALTGSIQDAKDRANFAAGQQGFQADQQRTAFGQGVTEAQLNEALTNGSFQRALQTLLAGSNGNPADIQLALSQIFGNQASNAGNALGGLIQNKTANSTNTGTNSYLAQLLAALTGGNTATATG